MPITSDQSSEEPFRAPRGRSRLHRATAILAALAISAGAVACGSATDGNGGGDDTTGDEAALSKQEYLQQVNAAQTDFASDAAKLNLANPSSAKQFGNSLGELDDLIERLRQRLDQMDEPEAVTTEQNALVRLLGDYGNAIRQQQGALTSGNPERARAAAQRVGKASTDFSTEFDATIKQVNRNLGLKTEGGSGQ
jgi:murein L,D-transpeptidase YcbB/YkuD